MKEPETASLTAYMPAGNALTGIVTWFSAVLQVSACRKFQLFSLAGHFFITVVLPWR
jgi:hypothetical protein